MKILKKLIFLKKLISIFKKKKYFPMPEEWLAVEWTEDAKGKNLKEDITKEIRIIKNEETTRVYPYSKELLYYLSKNFSLPFWDFTKDEGTLPTITKMRPEVIEYSSI